MQEFDASESKLREAQSGTNSLQLYNVSPPSLSPLLPLFPTLSPPLPLSHILTFTQGISLPTQIQTADDGPSARGGGGPGRRVATA